PVLRDNSAAMALPSADRLVTSAGMKYGVNGGLTVEPLMGLGYGERRFEQGSGLGTMVYKVHAQAGGKLSLLRSFYLSAAAKLPIYSYEKSDTGTAAGPPSVSFSHHEYDLLRLPGTTIPWTGEVGVHLGLGADLTIYYDQNLQGTSYTGASPARQEERFGTRIIFRFW
ncbi:MAG TPA: hypothetical protein VI389_01395, partial [Geobacteraceae bacterium]